MKKYLPLGVTALVSLSGCGSKSKQADAPPNIIYILADDMGYGDVSAYFPSGKIRTPNIDRLASQGMRFTDAHSPSSVSTPTRYGIMTGDYCWRSRLKTGVLRGYGRSLPEKGQPTVASLLREQSYRTGVIGKWHLGMDWVLKDGQEIPSADQEAMLRATGFITDVDPETIDFTKPPQNGPTQFGFDDSYILPASLDMEPYCYLRNDALTTLTNLMATAAGIAGVDPQKVTSADSYSILPVLLGQSQDVPGQQAVVHHSSRGHFAVRTGDWKLIQGKGSGGFTTTPAEEAAMTEERQLYDMAADPGETNNLYETNPEKVKALSALLDNIKANH